MPLCNLLLSFSRKADLPSRSQSPTKSPLQALATHGEADEAEKEESELEEEVPSQNGHPQLVLAPADGNILMNAIKRMDRKGWSLEG